jgi:hypothetical protein
MPEQRVDSAQTEGLSDTHRDLVSRYLAGAKGPAPRSALRFWIDGEWVEVSSAEPEPLVESLPTPTLPESTVDERPPPAGEEDASTPALVAAGAADAPEVELPIYRWLVADDTSDRGAPAPGWPRSLVTGSGPRLLRHAERSMT